MTDFLNIRLLLWVTLIFLGMTLFSMWQDEHAPQVSSQPLQSVVSPSEDLNLSGVPSTLLQEPKAPSPSSTIVVEEGRLVSVETDVLKLKIDTRGGDIVSAELKNYPLVKGEPDSGFMLLEQSGQKFNIAQVGLLGTSGPDTRQGRALYQSKADSYVLEQHQDKLIVELTWNSKNGLDVVKTFELKRGTYLIDVAYKIKNTTATLWQGKLYGQLQRTFGEHEKSGRLGMQTYTGAAVYTPEKKYKKVSFDSMEEKPFTQTITGGWAALVQHYFLSAWIPDNTSSNEYFTQVVEQKKYSIGSLSPVSISPQSEGVVKGQLYLGPETSDILKEVAPGLELTIDYGILWPISSLIFWVMKKIHMFIGNWGWSIILVTVFIKALFFKLSAASYRSMGHLRRVQPKIEALKERHGEDKQKFSQAMMELYKKEKINPLGGCLPILIQIPVFIALYYVLLESVELRQAPFMFWLQDLSLKDPYYVLPIIMGATMLLQQRLSPAPPDPIQAKMLMLMPVVFTFLFMSFPSGLVLYWVANNTLSILQQWLIMRKLEKEGLSHRGPVNRKAHNDS